MDSTKDQQQMENINMNNTIVSQDNKIIDTHSYFEYDESSDNESADLNYVLRDITDDDDVLPSNHKVSYEILSLSEIQKRQETDIINVSNALSIPRTEAIPLLLYCNWDADSVIDKWAENQKEFREEVGLCQKVNTKNEPGTNMGCKKCSGIVPDYLASVAFCGHKFCRTCWQDFVGMSLTGPSLLISCPDESCGGAISQELITLVGSPSEKSTYANIFMRSYLMDDRKGKWCPTLKCGHGVVLDSGNSISRFTCKCLLSFCYRCDKEDHHPVSCIVADNWRMESFSQSRNRKLLSVRDCPKCARPLERPEVSSSDMMRIECQSCKFDFCSTCNGSYLEHGNWQGDKFTHICPEELLQTTAEIEKYRENARKAVVRYHDYLGHWNSLHQEQHQILMRLRMMLNNEINILAGRRGLSLEEVSFVKEAWLQASECKRAFKWASVYDYYTLVFHENMIPFYNSLLDQGTFVLDELCKVSADLKHFIFGNSPPTIQFEEFRERLSFKTRVARNYFKSMEIAIYNGYPDMESLRSAIRARQQSIEPNPENDVKTNIGQTEDSSAVETSNWTCPHCSFSNYGCTTLCFMCYH